MHVIFLTTQIKQLHHHGCKTLRTNFCKHYPCLVLSIIWMKHLISLMFVLTSIEVSYV